MHHVDTAADRIGLLDPWPDRIFLKAGLNSADVEAVVEPLALGASTLVVSITRAELMRVIVGLITKDTPELIDHYLRARPVGRESFDLQLAFGYALMNEEQYALAPHAVTRFQAALSLAPNAETQLTTAQRKASRPTALYFQRWDGDPLAAKLFEDDCSCSTPKKLLAGAPRIELCSLANGRGNTRYRQAIQLLDSRPAIRRRRPGACERARDWSAETFPRAERYRSHSITTPCASGCWRRNATSGIRMTPSAAARPVEDRA